MLKNWNLMRIMRLAIGIIAVVQGIETQQWILSVLGGFFSLMALLNVGCCATGNCGVPLRKNTVSGGTEDISFEEVK